MTNIFVPDNALPIPAMDDGARNWMYAYAKKHYWRVAKWMEFDDLIQDGHFAWVEVCRRYPHAVDTPAWIMSLFKLCFSDKITDLARGRTKQQDDARSDIVDVYESPMMLVPDSSNFMALAIKAPPLVKDTIALLSDEARREELNKPFERYPNGRRETLNDRICSLLGLDPKAVDAVKTTRLYFSLA